MSVRTVVVAHREALAAEGIAAALARHPALTLVGVATTAAETEACATRADVVAIDARIDGASASIARLRRRGLRVVEIETEASVAQLASALAPGAQQADPSGSAAGALTPREGQVLRLAAKGLACKQIARTLAISPKTVEQHKTRAFRRLGVPNQAAAVALLVEGGGN